MISRVRDATLITDTITIHDISKLKRNNVSKGYLQNNARLHKRINDRIDRPFGLSINSFLSLLNTRVSL